MASVITILPPRHPEGSYEVARGTLRAEGRTAGEALDALTAPLTSEPATHVIIVQAQRPNPFFGAAEQAHLEVLMQHFHEAQAGRDSLSDAERADALR